MKLIVILIVCIVNSCFLADGKLYSQSSDGLSFENNKNGLFVAANVIYNFTSSKDASVFEYPKGYNLNTQPPNKIFFTSSSEYDTQTFGLNVSYNLKIRKNISLSFGLGYKQYKRITKYSVYIDSNVNQPDLVSNINKLNIVFIPIKINYFYKKFIFSFGTNVYVWYNDKYTKYFEDKSKNVFKSKSFTFAARIEESISYKILKEKNLFIYLAAEQTSSFYKRYGYNNFFMLGASYYFN